MGISEKFFVSSSATSAEEIWNGVGNPVYPPAERVLNAHGINCRGKRAVQLRKSDYDKFDYFIGMDGANIRNMNIILGGDPENKIYKMMSFVGCNDDVADPWYTGDFDLTYKNIREGCEGLLEFILNK